MYYTVFYIVVQLGVAVAVALQAEPVAPLATETAPPAEASRAEPNNRRLQADSAAIGGNHTKKNRKTKIKTQRPVTHSPTKHVTGPYFYEKRKPAEISARNG